jgi:hypothetical protein
LLFRGALFGWLRARLPAWPTIILTATLWTAMHVGLLVALPYVLVRPKFPLRGARQGVCLRKCGVF